MSESAKTRLLHAEVRRRRRLRARRDRLVLRRMVRIAWLALVVVASCSAAPLHAEAPRAPAPAVSTYVRPFALGHVEQIATAQLLATVPHRALPEYAMAWKY